MDSADNALDGGAEASLHLEALCVARHDESCGMCV